MPVRRLDGKALASSSPGGMVWETISAGGQIIALETTKGQDVLDLTEATEQTSRTDPVAGWLGSLSLASGNGGWQARYGHALQGLEEYDGGYRLLAFRRRWRPGIGSRR